MLIELLFCCRVEVMRMQGRGREENNIYAQESQAPTGETSDFVLSLLCQNHRWIQSLSQVNVLDNLSRKPKPPKLYSFDQSSHKSSHFILSISSTTTEAPHFSSVHRNPPSISSRLFPLSQRWNPIYGSHDQSLYHTGGNGTSQRMMKEYPFFCVIVSAMTCTNIKIQCKASATLSFRHMWPL